MDAALLACHHEQSNLEGKTSCSIPSCSTSESTPGSGWPVSPPLACSPAALLFMVVGLLIILKSQGTDLLTIVTADPLSPEEGEPNLAAKPANTMERG
jgi:hypothetical protein